MTNTFFSRKMLSIALLGMASGIPLGVVLTLIQTWLSDSGIDLKTVGAISLVQLPYTFKFLWSPVLDHYRMPFLGRRQGWMLVTQILMAITVACFSFLDPSQDTVLIACFAIALSFFGASHDIVIDAFRRDVLDENELGFGSAVATNSYLVGFRFLSVVLGLTLADAITWNRMYLILACLPLLGIAGTLLAPAEKDEVAAPKSIKDATIQPFLNFLSRPGAIEILLFILLYKVGDNLAANLLTPFYLKIGFTKTEIAWAGKLVGFWSMFAGGFIGGALLSRFKMSTCLFWFSVLQAAGLLIFPLMTPGATPMWLFCTGVGFENLTAGMGTAAIATFMLRLCDKRFSATQYALLTSFMGIPRTIIPSVAGFIAEPLGWTWFFIICALLAIPGLAMLVIRGKRWQIA